MPTDDVNDVCPIDGQIEVISSDNGSWASSMMSFQLCSNRTYIEHFRRQDLLERVDEAVAILSRGLAQDKVDVVH